jgi:hypothetical protein
MFLRNVCWLSTDYMALYLKRIALFITTAVRTSDPIEWNMLVLRVSLFYNIPVGENPHPLCSSKLLLHLSRHWSPHPPSVSTNIHNRFYSACYMEEEHTSVLTVFLELKVHSLLLLQNTALSRVKFCAKTCFCSSVIKPCCGGFVCRHFGEHKDEDGDCLF